MADISVYVIEDDWGYDGMHLIGVAATLEGAKSYTTAHCHVYHEKRTLPTEWREVVAQLGGMSNQRWASNDTNDSGYKYIITEVTLVR